MLHQKPAHGAHANGKEGLLKTRSAEAVLRAREHGGADAQFCAPPLVRVRGTVQAEQKVERAKVCPACASPRGVGRYAMFLVAHV